MRPPGLPAHRLAPLRALVGAGSALALALVAGLAAAQTPPAPAGSPATAAVSEEAVSAVAAQLRCVVCQNLSVQDSPSEMARQMRDLIRERMAGGDTPAEVLAYFEARYGPWVLLSPRLRGFGLLVWLLPAAGLLLGSLVVARLARRWARRGTARVDGDGGGEGRGSPDDGRAAEPFTRVAAADRERVRRELERLA